MCRQRAYRPVSTSVLPSMDKTLQNFAYTWAKLAPETYNWLRSLDPSFRFALFSLYTAPRFSFPGTASLNIGALISTYSRWKDFSKSSFNRPKEEKLNGEALFACLRNGVESRKIKEIYGARVTGLLKNKKGRICGVAATEVQTVVTENRGSVRSCSCNRRFWV